MISVLIMDVDGCLTDGKVYYTATDDEIKGFNVKDGLAIKTWMKMGNRAVIITGRNSKIVKRRSQELGIEHCFQGIRNKSELLLKLVNELGVSLENVAAIGDDLNDYKMLQLAKVSFSPHNASTHIKNSVTHVLGTNGGNGAVREAIEFLVEMNGQEDEFLSHWL